MRTFVRLLTVALLACSTAGAAATELLRSAAAAMGPGTDRGNHGPGQYSKHGLAMLMDGEKLAKELGPLLGRDHWGNSSEFLLGRFAGPAALPFLEKHLGDRGWAAPLAIGSIGGPEAAKALTELLAKEPEFIARRSACQMLKEIKGSDPLTATSSWA